jgi:hypothetical protein
MFRSNNNKASGFRRSVLFVAAIAAGMLCVATGQAAAGLPGMQILGAAKAARSMPAIASRITTTPSRSC